MKKSLIFLAVLVAVTIFPLAAYADNNEHGRGQSGLHDRMEQNRHEQTWKDHEQQWRDYDRQWREHSHNQRWREKHAKEWSDWYRWHQDNENRFHLNISGDRFDLDING